MPTSENALPKRRTVRMPGYDYSSPGEYFVTICAAGRKPIFGRPTPTGVMRSKIGDMAEARLEWLSRRYPHVRVDSHMVMPEHVHMLLAWDHPDQDRTPLAGLVRAYKGVVTSDVRAMGGREVEVWQRGYYEHVIRDDEDLWNAREYIRLNPEQATPEWRR